MRCKYRTKRVYTILNNTKLKYKNVPFNQLFTLSDNSDYIYLKYKGITRNHTLRSDYSNPEMVWFTGDIKKDTSCTIIINKKLHKKMVKGVEDLVIFKRLE